MIPPALVTPVLLAGFVTLGPLVAGPDDLPDPNPSVNPPAWDFEARYDLSGGVPAFEIRGVISHAFDCLVEWHHLFSTTTAWSVNPPYSGSSELYRVLGNYGLSHLRFEHISGNTISRHDYWCDTPVAVPLSGMGSYVDEEVDGERVWDTGTVRAPDVVLAESSAPARLCAKLGFMPTFAVAGAVTLDASIPFTGYMLASVRNSATDYIYSDLRGPYIAGTGPWNLPDLLDGQPELPTDAILGDESYSPGWSCGGDTSIQGTWAMRAEVLGLDPWGSVPLGTWRVVVDGRNQAP